MWLRYGIALIGVIIGFALGWQVIKRERRPSACDDGLLWWDEKPISAWCQDWTIASFIALHSASIIILAVLFLLDITWREGKHTLFLLDATPLMPGAERSQFYQTLETVVTAGVGLVWFVCGTLLAFFQGDAHPRRLLRAAWFNRNRYGGCNSPSLVLLSLRAASILNR